jgi:hypothetical protein
MSHEDLAKAHQRSIVLAAMASAVSVLALGMFAGGYVATTGTHQCDSPTRSGGGWWLLALGTASASIAVAVSAARSRRGVDRYETTVVTWLLAFTTLTLVAGVVVVFLGWLKGSACFVS